MEAVQTAEPSIRSTATFESVWATLDKIAESQKENDERFKRQHEEINQILKESAEIRKETERTIDKAGKRLDQVGKRLNQIGKRFGDFTNSFGEVVEYMIAPNLQKKFNDFGYSHKTKTIKRRYLRGQRKKNRHRTVDN